MVLAVGIGINTAVYSVVYEVLLRSLPYGNGNRIVQIGVPSVDAFNSATATQSWIGLEEWRAGTMDLEQLAGIEATVPQNLKAGDSIIEVTNVRGTANLLQVPGVAPVIGRIMSAGEDIPEAEPVVVLSGSVWESIFAKDPAVVGKKVLIQGKPHIVIGVMPTGFSFPFGGVNQVWTATDLDSTARSDRSAGVLTVIGLLKPGVRLEKVVAELSTIQSNAAQAYANLHLGNHITVEKYQAFLTASYRRALSALQAAVLMVWLIACINVSSLMLTRSVARRNEIILKRALGASGFRLAQQTMLESFIISFCGGAVGLGLGMISVHLLQNEITRLIPLYHGIQLHGAVLVVLAAASILTSVTAGILPVLYSTRAPAYEVVRIGSLIAGIGVRHRRLRDAMVIGEIALTLVLLAAAGLMLRTLQALHNVPLGFNESKVLTASLVFQDGDYSKKNIYTAVYSPLLQGLKQLPGVQAVALSSVLPMRSEFNMQASFAILGDRRGSVLEPPHADLRIATSGLATSLGARMLQGRFFGDQDSADSQPVAVINHSFLARYLSAVDPFSFKLSFGKKGRFSSVTIIGVIDDMKQIDLARAAEPEVYLCASQVTPDTAFYFAATAATQLAVRTSSNPEIITTSTRKILHAIDPDAHGGEIKTLHQIVEDSIGNQRIAVKLLGLFAATALLLSLSGFYGLLQFSVSQATRGIGVRLAVGAQRSHVVGLVVMHALTIMGTGLAIGVFFSFLLQRMIRAYLFGLEMNGLLTIIAVTFAFSVCAALAAYPPARRAAAIDPMQALREQ
jgi:predicted permease